jgi:hypothetical protein
MGSRQTEKYLYPVPSDDDNGQDIVERDLRVMTQMLQGLESCNILIKDNLRVLNSLKAFYRDELLKDMDNLNVAWKGAAKDCVRKFSESLEMVIEENKELFERVEVLETLAGNREDFVSPNPW